MNTAELIYDMSMDRYLVDKRLGSHSLSLFASRGPRAFIMRLLDLDYDADSDAKRFGRMFEDIAQGRELDVSRYIVKPPGLSFGTVEGKEWRDRQVECKVKNQAEFDAMLKSRGKEMIAQEELDAMRWMHESFQENERAMAVVKGSTKQATILADDAPYGLKSRPDYLMGRTTVDLKTVRNLNIFVKEVRERNYHVQAAIAAALLQRCVMGGTAHYCLAVEKEFPYRCQLVRITEDWLRIGADWAARVRAQIAACADSGMWPRVLHEEIEMPAPPEWLR